MRLSTKAQHAVNALIGLSINKDSGRQTVADMAQRFGISISYLEQLFAGLSRQGLVKGMRGPGGGYGLAKPPTEITIAEVILAVDIKAYNPQRPSVIPLFERERHRVGLIWADLSTDLFNFLNGISLADIIQNGGNHSAAIKR